MRNIIRNLLISFIALISISSLTSCDEDVDRSIVLAGQWTGDFKMYYSDGYGNTFDAEYSDIQLIPAYNYATYGTGQEVDFFSNRPYGYDGYGRPIYCPLRYQTFYFKWEVKDGYIYLYYPYNSDLNVAIYDYSLSPARFRGYFGDSHTFFDLHKLEDFYWSDYNYNDNYYGYGYWNSYYRKALPTEEKTISSSDSISIYNQIQPNSFSFGRRRK